GARRRWIASARRRPTSSSWRRASATSTASALPPRPSAAWPRARPSSSRWRDRRSDGPPCRHAEARHVQRQRHRYALAAPAGMAGEGTAGHRRAAGTQGDGPGVPGRGYRSGRLWRDLARAAFLEWRRVARPRRGAGGKQARTAGRSEGRAEPLPGSGGAWHRRGVPLPAQWQSAARPEVRLQAQVDGAAAPACEDAGRPRAPGGAGRGLQRDPHRRGRLRPEVLAQGCADPARVARSVRGPARTGLDRRPAPRASGRAHLHVLGLFPPARRARSRPAHRPPAAEPDAGEGAEGRRRGPLGAAATQGQRPRADLGDAVAPRAAVGYSNAMIKPLMISALVKSMKDAPTSGATRKARGAAP